MLFYVKYGNKKAQEYPMTIEVEEKFQTRIYLKTEKNVIHGGKNWTFNMYEYKILLLITWEIGIAGCQ